MTKKPCPGCMVVVPSRKVSNVCYACRRKLEMFDKQTENDREHRDRGESLFVVPFNWPHIIVNKSHCSGSRNADAMCHAFLDLLRGREDSRQFYAGEHRQLFDGNPGGSAANWLWISDATVKAVLRLDGLVRAAIEEAHNDGRRMGEDLIGRLASGELSLSELQERGVNR